MAEAGGIVGRIPFWAPIDPGSSLAYPMESLVCLRSFHCFPLDRLEQKEQQGQREKEGKR